MPRRAIIFANGTLPDPEHVRRLIDPAAALLISADGGTRHALALNLMPSVIIGDLDSLPDDIHQIAEQAGTQFIAHPRDKDETDLELAVQYARLQGAREIVIVAALGRRLDQTLANLSLLTDPQFAKLDIRLEDGVEQVWFVRSESEIHGEAGDIVSLIPWGGPVTNVSTKGLRWDLHGESLQPYRTRGISNEMLGEKARIRIGNGLLLVIHRRRKNNQ